MPFASKPLHVLPCDRMQSRHGCYPRSQRRSAAFTRAMSRMRRSRSGASSGGHVGGAEVVRRSRRTGAGRRGGCSRTGAGGARCVSVGDGGDRRGGRAAPAARGRAGGRAVRIGAAAAGRRTPQTSHSATPAAFEVSQVGQGQKLMTRIEAAFREASPRSTPPYAAPRAIPSGAMIRTAKEVRVQDVRSAELL